MTSIPASPALVSGDLDPRTRRFLHPTRIVWQSPAPAAPENAAHLLRANIHQAVAWKTPCCTLRRSGAICGLVLDFGKELYGGLRLVIGATPDNKPVRLRIRFGESVAEAMAEPFPIHGHAVHDDAVLVPWFGSHEFGSTGFRFARIDVMDEGAWVELVSVRAVSYLRDVPRLGSFRCDDERINRVWETGADTVHLCMQDMLWDGIKRDRLVWIGDTHPESMVISTVFGGHPIVRECLDFVRDQTPLPGWMHGISSYSLWWILIHRDWYAYHGDLAYLREQRAYLVELLAFVISKIDADGRETLDGFRFLDWPSSPDQAAVHAGLQSLMVLALETGAHLCAVLNDGAMSARCAEAVARLKRHVPEASPTKQANALTVLAELADAKAINQAVLARAPLSGLSTFYGYYVLQARARAGDHAGCLDAIRSFWGGMLDLGATSFWEDFNLDWTANAGRIDEPVPPGMKDIHGDFGDFCYKGFRHSLCHGWAAGPTAWLSEHVLGITPATPGFETVRVRPRLGGLRWAEGTFPTPRGVVTVRHELSADGSVRSTVDAPPGMRVRRE